MALSDLLPVMTLEEVLNLNQHRALRAVLRLLLAEVNARRAFDAAIVSDFLAELNRRREFDAAIYTDLLEQLNAVRGLLVPALPVLTSSDLTAQPPGPISAVDLTARAPSVLSIGQILSAIKLEVE